MKKYILLFTTGLLLLASPSCTDDFNEINQDPNRVKTVTAANLLSPVLYDMQVANLNRSHRINNELMQVSVTKASGNEFHRYVIRPGESDYFWENYYRQLNNVQDMYDKAVASNQPEYAGVALVLRSWIYSLLTDMFGDIPYSQALQGLKERKFTPAFDPQAEVYTGILNDLEQANEMLASGEDLEANLDILYAGNLVLWRKFANSLRLRLLMRVSGKPEMLAAEKIAQMVADPAKYPIFENNTEGAVLKFAPTPPVINPFTNWRDYDFNGDRGISEFFLKNLTQWNDPRLPLWVTQVSKKYVGVPSGYPVAQTSEINSTTTSTYQKTLKTSDKLGVILPYAEVEFLLAEAALKGWIASDAKTHYEKGITAAIEHWGVTVPEDFLQKEGVAFDGGLETVLLQKYYALFFTDFQQWFEFRRTGFPVLPKGAGLQNNAQMPNRLKYPTIVQSLNQENYQQAADRMGGDDINVKVWWEK